MLAASVFINLKSYKSTPEKGAIRLETAAAQPQAASQGRTPPLAAQNNNSAPASSSLRSDSSSGSISPLNKTAQADQVQAQPSTPGWPKHIADDRRELGPLPDESKDTARTLPRTNAWVEPQTAGVDDKINIRPIPDTAPRKTTSEPSMRVSSPHVARAQFTTGIRELEPVDHVEAVFPMEGEALRTLFYFTEIIDMDGETVTHRWEHEGTVMAEISFDIGGNRWRVWSSKDLTPSMGGRWRVVVVDTKGNEIKTDHFLYQTP
jgi:hypothetical protein